MNLTAPAAVAAFETAFLDMLREEARRLRGVRVRGEVGRAGQLRRGHVLVTCGADVPFARTAEPMAIAGRSSASVFFQ